MSIQWSICHLFTTNRWGNSDRLYFGGLQITKMVTTAMKLKDSCSLEEKLWQTQTAYSKAEILLYWQRSSSQSYGFSSNHVWMWELDHREGWALKDWCFWTVVLEKTLESPLDCKIQSVYPKANQPWTFIGKTDAETEAPILWPSDAKSQFIIIDPDAGKDRRQEKWTTEDDRGWDGWMSSPAQWTWV